MLTLEIQDGPYRRPLVLEDGIVRIGRHPDCELFLGDDPTVSRVHAVLAPAADGWSVTDSGSRNGTTVDGVPIAGSVPATAGTRVGVGRWSILVTGRADAPLLETLPADTAQQRTISGLSLRESEIVRWVAAGLTDQQIAAQLFLSVKTVHSHLDRIKDKTGHRRRAELTRLAVGHGLG